MTQKYVLGGKPSQSGNKISHSHRKTRRKWLINAKKRAIFSMALGRQIRMTVTTSFLRTLDKVGGLDNYILREPPESLTSSLRLLQNQIREKAARAA